MSVLKILKNKKAVSPVVATVLIIGLTLAAAAIVFLVVIPMLDSSMSPNLILDPVSFRDYDNDGSCDYMVLQINNLPGGADATITQVIILGAIGTESKETSWIPFTNESRTILEGSTRTIKLIAEQDDTDEIPQGSDVAVTIVSNEAAVDVFEIGVISVITGNPVQVEFVDASSIPIEGANVDFYYETGEYAYNGDLTNDQGMSETYLFPGRYYARAISGVSLYYSEPFLHPGEGLIHLAVTGGTFSLKVQSGATPLSSVITYLFDDNGHYLGDSTTTGLDGIATYSLEGGRYIFRADYLGGQYYSALITYPNQTSVIIDVGGGDIYCKVIDGADNPITNVRVYLFRESGSYTGKSDRTNDTGYAEFLGIAGGQLYKFRVDYLALQLWSQTFGAAHNSVIPINVGGGTIYVNVTDGSGNPIINTRTYLFTQSGSYSGRYANTNNDGIATYERIAGGWFKIRIDYMAKQFWSPIFNATHGYVVQASIGGGTLFGNITAGGNALVNVRVYLFTDTNSYTGRYGNTDLSGIVEIQGVGEGSYKMRVDYQASQHWSDIFFFNETAIVHHDVGGGTVYANITAGGTPITNTRVYVFTSSGSYTGTYANTNEYGIAEFALSGGDYKLRVDYLSRQFWSDIFTASDELIVDIDLGGGDIYAHLTNNYGIDISGVRIYLFTESNSYTGKYANTDSSGIAVFTGIGEANYKFRADYLAKQYWSNVFAATPDLLFEFNIGGGIVWMYAHDASDTPITGARCYLFTSTNSYTGIYRDLNASGYIEFDAIGNGTFKWRVDYLSKQFWSPEFEAINGTILDYDLGGGTILCYVEVDGNHGINIRVYLFTSTNRYTGKNVYTNISGYALFTGVGAGDYKFRADHSDQHWSDVFTASPDLVVNISITTLLILRLATSDISRKYEIRIPPILFS